MTPYTKKIVELHKIHKAIEEKDCCNGGGNTPSGDIGYEEIYQFYKKQITERLPQEALNSYVIPETFNDIKVGNGQLYENGQFGIWFKSYYSIYDIPSTAMIFFTTFDDSGNPDRVIYIGEYVKSDK